MLNAIQQYTKEQLDGLESPQLDPLEALIQPPVMADIADHPFAFIWGGHAPIRRQTAPRVIRQPGGGFSEGGYQQADWKVDVRLYTMMDQQDPNIESAFPALVDAVIVQVTTTPIAIITTDPITGQLFEILMFGESVDVDYASAVTTNAQGQGIVRFACDLAVGLTEKIAQSEGLPS